MPFLGDGSIMGIFEMIIMLVISFFIVCGPSCNEMSNKHRLVAFTVTIYFVVQSIFFGKLPSEFLYFQF